jgi:hypothetical protein
MSTYIDPATALRIARASQADDIRLAQRRRLARSARRPAPPKPPAQRRPWFRVSWNRPAVAH